MEELLRLGSPARFLIRRATDDLTIGGTAIGQGEIVILAIGMANRDPDVFPDPDQFDGSRKRISHLAFGLRDARLPGRCPCQGNHTGGTQSPGRATER